MKARSFSHVGITVSDFNRAVRFYWEGMTEPVSMQGLSVRAIDLPARGDARRRWRGGSIRSTAS